MTLNERRFDGVTQQAYVILNPAFYPAIPSLAALHSRRGSRSEYSSRRGRHSLAAPVPGKRRHRAAIEPDVAAHTHMGEQPRRPSAQRARPGPIAAPAHRIGGRKPAEPGGGQPECELQEDHGCFRKLRSLTVRDDNEGLPADPYNLRAEWGPSSYGDVRHRGVITASAPLPWRNLSASPLFLVVNSGPPYNITTGLDPNHTGTATARPGLVAGPCQGAGCFNLNPAPGTEIEHYYGRGPGAINVAMRLSRTWTFGPERAAAPADTGGGHGGPMALSLRGASGGRRYAVTLSASTLNALNHVNFAPPNGDLLVAVLRAVPGTGRHDRDESRGRSQHLQPEDRFAAAVQFLAGESCRVSA